MFNSSRGPLHLHQTDQIHNFNPIMLQLSQHNNLTYYAPNYAGIICQGLSCFSLKSQFSEEKNCCLGVILPHKDINF